MKPESIALELVGIAVEASQPSGAAVGRVDDAGQGAAALLGMRVLVGPLDACGQCEVCRRGGATVCPLATRRELPVGSRLRVASRWVVALADGLDLPVPAAAAVAGDVTCAYTLYARTGLASREPVVVLGTNAIARFLVEILRSKGITPTVIVDPHSAAEGRGAARSGEAGPFVPADAAWRDWLLAKGAAAITDALPATVAAAIAAQGQGSRPLRVIVTDARELPRAASLAGPRATITVLTDRDVPALPGDVLAREVTVIGVAGPHPDLVVEAAALCVKGDIDLIGGVQVGDTTDATRATVIVR